jgi:hypothetical protein
MVYLSKTLHKTSRKAEAISGETKEETVIGERKAQSASERTTNTGG